MAAVTSTAAPGATPAPDPEKITWTRADGSEVPGLAYGTSEPAATSAPRIPTLERFPARLSSALPPSPRFLPACARVGRSQRGSLAPSGFRSGEARPARFARIAVRFAGAGRALSVVGRPGAPKLFARRWGITEDAKAQAHFVASKGYRVIIPDLYRGKLTLDAAEAKHTMDGLDFPGAVEDIRGAAKLLREEGSAGVGVAGTCMGGALALAAGGNCPEVVTCVSAFYGVPPKALSDMTKMTVPTIAHFGEPGARDQGKSVLPSRERHRGPLTASRTAPGGGSRARHPRRVAPSLLSLQALLCPPWPQAPTTATPASRTPPRRTSSRPTSRRPAWSTRSSATKVRQLPSAVPRVCGPRASSPARTLVALDPRCLCCRRRWPRVPQQPSGGRGAQEGAWHGRAQAGRCAGGVRPHVRPL